MGEPGRERKFTQERSLHVFAVDEAVEWDDIAAPDGTGHGRVRGVLAITDRRLSVVNARGVVDVYIKRMFISAGNREVLPPWAKFLQGVLECNELTPNAAPGQRRAQRCAGRSAADPGPSHRPRAH